MATSMLAYHFKRMAEEFGYGDLKVCFSLGFCQGDHVSFDGSLAGSDLDHLGERLLKGEASTAAKRAVEKGYLEKVILRDGSVYDEWGCESDDLTALEIQSAEDLFEAIKEEIKDLQRTLRRQGHDLILNGPGHEGEVLREFSTENFTLKVTLVDDEHDDWDASGCSDWDWAEIWDQIHDHHMFGLIKIEVLDECGDELTTYHGQTVWLSKKEKPWNQLLRTCNVRASIREAIEEAREACGMTKTQKTAEAA